MEPFLGQIMQVGFNYAPKGWATCQGQLMAINQNTALFSLLGTTFGGNGTQNFGLPNAQSRVFVGAGQGAGLSSYYPGQMAGAEQVTLTTAQMPAHIHTLQQATGSMQAVNNNTVANTTETPEAGAMLGIPYNADGSGSPTIYVPAGTSGSTTVNLGGVQMQGNTSVTGSNMPFSVLSPYLAITTIIAIEGIFPSRP